MFRSRHETRLLFPILLLVAIVVSCASSQPAPRSGKPAGPLGVKTLLVVPFHIASERYEVGTTLQCSMCGAVFVTGPVDPGDDTYMTEQLLTYLKTRTSYKLTPPGTAEGVRSKILADSLGMSRRDLLVEMARKSGSDAVVSGTLFRFRQRVGTGYSVETPASVAFSLYLIRAADGRMLWDGHFDETQKPLSEDLFRFFSFLKGGGGWLTAEELARQGIDKVMETFPLP